MHFTGQTDAQHQKGRNEELYCYTRSIVKLDHPKHHHKPSAIDKPVVYSARLNGAYILPPRPVRSLTCKRRQPNEHEGEGKGTKEKNITDFPVCLALKSLPL